MMDKADLKQFGEFIGSRLTAKRVSQTRFGSILGEVRGGVIVDKGLLSKIISGTYVSVLSPKTSWGIDCITALAQLGCIEGMEDVRRGIELVGHTLSHDDIENIKSILQSRKENLEISSDSDLYSAQEISTPESNYSPQIVYNLRLINT